MLKKIKINEKWEREHFDRLAKRYERQYDYTNPFTKYKFKKKIDKFVDFVRLSFGEKAEIKILEIGCGTGAYTVRYAERLPKADIMAIDISSEMIKVARKKGRARNNLIYQEGSAYKTGFKDSSFDVVCGFYILHHLNLQAVIKEIDRVLKPGGLIYFYEPNILNPIVFLIKSNNFVKGLIGDSHEEWAINPLKVPSDWKGFKIVEVKTTEFIWPASFVSYRGKLFLDRISSWLFGKLPILSLLGGSVEICLKKK